MVLPGLDFMRNSYSELVMSDEVEVTRKPFRQMDAMFDPVTGKYHNNTTNESVVYQGSARIRKSGKAAREENKIDDGTNQVLNRYELDLPFGSPAMQTGYEVKVTISDNPSLVGETFTILSPSEGSASVAGRATMTRRETNRDG